ncbi:LOW QUALITY PROTEIN: phosphatidylinositol 3-kinase C2 domain-containing subunit gamma [Perognathus longimembris pacificus]|uniref:LOW QUALITY PROTEIN: phosphatidylinositol 3-kinase C2 domain-containing subunit gamma n=1 Tax=Perognathus longimembris pacificus TaxID=214514 RepID=UPI00201A0E72|nr:LOW QUALITY PROTEIN: phosphatidylinositol 3-kinase C2 domain-containing subunit gamma [Perognathus longimembris pacificus]
MAHHWHTDGDAKGLEQSAQVYSYCPSAHTPQVPRKVSLGFDHLTAESHSTIPLSQRQSEEHPCFVPQATQGHLLHDRRNPREWEEARPGYHIGFEGSLPLEDPSFPADFLPRQEVERCGRGDMLEPWRMFSKDGSFPPKVGGNSWMEDKEPSDGAIQIVEAHGGSHGDLTSFCDHVEKIRETYQAEDIHSNSGKFWSVTTAFPSQLCANTRFSVDIYSDNMAQALHFIPSANYLVKDLIADILHLFPNDRLFPKDHLLQLCGLEEFLQSDHCLGSHKIFQKDKSVIQLHLQKNKETPGKFSRKPKDDSSRFHASQLLECAPGWKESRQGLLMALRSYGVQVEHLLQIQEEAEDKGSPAIFPSAGNPFQQCVKNVMEEVKNICSLLGCVETKQITDAVNELRLMLQRKAEDVQPNSETSGKDIIKEITMELTRAIHQLMGVYCNSFHAGFRLLHAPGSSSRIHPGLLSHLSFTVCGICNIPEPWARSYDAFSFSCWLTYAGKKLCQVQNYRTIPAKKWFFFLVNWNEMITFPLEIKSLPRESMLTVKLFGTSWEHANRHVLAWSSFPLFPEGNPMGGPRLFSMTLQKEPPIETIAPGVWDTSQPSPLTLQVDFPDGGWRYTKPDLEESSVNLEEPPQECLKHIARLSRKLSPSLLSEEKRRYLWFYRFHCSHENCSLPLVLGSAPGWDERTVTEMRVIARRWTFLHPLEALGLLTSSFPDQEIRKVAVHQLDRLPNDELQEYLPQLVQAVKFEWSLESPLVNLLLHRSLQSIQMAHQLYWLLKDALNESYFQGWYQKLLAAFQFCVGEALNNEFSKERKLVHILGDIAEKVKSASDSQRQEVLEEELGRLEEFFQDIKTCHLPVSPALCVKGIDRNACSYFTSHALPLKISVINANPMGKNTSIIFKTGDDLRQDMLVLQLVEAMDKMWLQEGLDLQMVTYRCLSTGKSQGLVQMVPQAVTLAHVHRQAGLLGPLKENSIQKWFRQHHGSGEDYEKALRNFLFSCAGWCVVTFVLGVCDRHNDNIMLTTAGHMFHIDFGKFLGHAQMFGGSKGQDRAPFIFTSEMEYFITEGGKNPQQFQDFVELCCRAYNIVRRHSRLLLNLLEMMLHAGLPELRGIQDLKYVYKNLRPQDTDLEATSHFTRKIKESVECFPVKLNNFIHILAQMAAISPTKSASHRTPQESCVSRTTRIIQRATILGFSKTHPHHLYLIQVVRADQEISLTEKSFDQLSILHGQLQKQFPSLTLPEFPHWWHLPFTSSDHKRLRDLNRYLEGVTGGPGEVANSDCVLSFFLSEPVQQKIEDSALGDLSQKPLDNSPKVQLLISHEGTKLTILVKHMKNIHLPDGSAPSAHAEFYLLPHPNNDQRRKTKSVPKCANPTYNEIVVYDGVTELEGRVLMLIVKSKTVFVGAINIYLCSVPLNEEKWYPLGNSII